MTERERVQKIPQLNNEDKQTDILIFITIIIY